EGCCDKQPKSNENFRVASGVGAGTVSGGVSGGGVCGGASGKVGDAMTTPQTLQTFRNRFRGCQTIRWWCFLVLLSMGVTTKSGGESDMILSSKVNVKGKLQAAASFTSMNVFSDIGLTAADDIVMIDPGMTSHCANIELGFNGYSCTWITLMHITISHVISQDFYLDLVEDNKKITPRDYLELALRPVQGEAIDVSAKNEVGVPVMLYQLTHIA
ncbi:LOW QUALITY PROTEIN: hypothetical protein M8C21_001254, partial [Ambrosia artemisiifolia]